jgi:pyridoxal phosphate-dependent aminotransferase EpsN
LWRSARPTLTFVATANPIRYLGAEPVLIDSDPVTWNLDPTLVAEALAERARQGRLPRAVVVVHLYGQTADMDPIVEACRRYDVPILEDAAEALGAEYKGRRAGSLGPLAVLSFNGNKIITTSGGGALVASDPSHAEKARFWSTQARDPGLAYEHSEVGYNYRLSNVLAGIGRGQLKVLDERARQRRVIAFRYRDELAELEGLSLMPQASYGLHTNWLSCFLVDERVLRCSRDALIAGLASEDIEARPVWKPMHLQPLYASAARYGGDVAADLFRRGICLPSGTAMTADDQGRVIESIRRTVRAGRGA